jgi:hypothetical protein
MIALLHRLPVGNAVRVLLMPPPGAVSWRVLRKDADTIAGPDDEAALVVFEGSERAFLDATWLENDVTAYYQPFYRTSGGGWASAPSVSITPAATFSDASADPQRLVRDRLELGLRAYVARGELAHEMGFIPVLTAPPLLEEVRLPVVTVEHASDGDAQRFIGNGVGADRFDGDQWSWQGIEGLLSRVQLVITAWSLNPDERIALRRALRMVLLGNEPVFADAGLAEIDLSSFSDLNDFESFDAPIYRTACTLTCLVPVLLEGADPAVREVVLTLRS